MHHAAGAGLNGESQGCMVLAVMHLSIYVIVVGDLGLEASGR